MAYDVSACLFDCLLHLGSSVACGDSPSDIIADLNNDAFSESSSEGGKTGEDSKLSKHGWRAGNAQAGEWVEVCT